MTEGVGGFAATVMTGQEAGILPMTALNIKSTINK